MGYDLHITRRENWFDEDGPSISRAEWLALVEADPEMRLDGHAEADLTDGAVLRVDDPTMAVWAAWAHDGVNGNHAWLWLDGGGNVVAKNPAPEVIAKMHAIALRLDARVQGDDGEIYGSDGQLAADTAPVASTGWLSRIFGRQ